MQHYDFQTIDKASIEKTSQGFLRIPVFANRTGIQLYRTSNGDVLREMRFAEEVFSQDTLKSIRNVPFTNRHPKDNVTIDNAKEVMVGLGGDTVEIVDNKFTKLFVIVTDPKTVEDIEEHGIIEVSCGYELELDFTPGEFDGEKFDAIQRNIKMNHLALVPKGRGGPEVRLRIDTEDGMHYAVSIDPKNSSGEKMKIKIGDSEFEVNDDLQKAIKAELDAKTKLEKDLEEAKKTTKGDGADELKAANDSLKEEKDKNKTLSDEKDVLQAKVDSTEESKDDKDPKKGLNADQIDAAVRDRRKVERVAEQVLDAEGIKGMDDLSTKDLKVACIKAEYPKTKVKLDEATDVYLKARFDAIAESMDVSAEANQGAGRTVMKKRSADAASASLGDAEKQVEEAREKSRKADEDAWKQPIGQAAKSA